MGSGARAAPAVWRKPRMKVVGRVRVDDVPTIAAIERRSFSDPWSERSFRDVLSHPQIYFACIRDLVDGGWTVELGPMGTPEGDATALVDPSGTAIALLQVDRPGAMDSAYADEANTHAVR